MGGLIVTDQKRVSACLEVLCLSGYGKEKTISDKVETGSKNAANGGR